MSGDATWEGIKNMRFWSGLCLLLVAGQTSGQTVGGRLDTPSPAASLQSDQTAGSCLPVATIFCAHDSRFLAQATFSAPTLGISNASATAVSLTNDSGYFWFFSPNNVELVVKVVDGRAFNGFFWVFVGALSDVAYEITVTDTQTGAVKTYANTAGNLRSFADTAAFSGTHTCTYLVSAPVPQHFSQVGGGGSVTVTTQPECPWTAVSNSLFIYNVTPAASAGSGVVNFGVAAQLSPLHRTGRMTIAGAIVEISQD